jgi:TRAP-type C4-dicarboxylate transport system substrate-binding protein
MIVGSGFSWHFNEVLMEAASKATEAIRASEQKLVDEFRKLGKTVVEVDREAFIAAAKPLHNDPDAGAGWTKEQYEAFLALK